MPIYAPASTPFSAVENSIPAGSFAADYPGIA
jgi:hypothetical protein